jgi:hypothetical protein
MSPEIYPDMHSMPHVVRGGIVIPNEGLGTRYFNTARHVVRVYMGNSRWEDENCGLTMPPNPRAAQTPLISNPIMFIGSIGPWTDESSEKLTKDADRQNRVCPPGDCPCGRSRAGCDFHDPRFQP